MRTSLVALLALVALVIGLVTPTAVVADDAVRADALRRIFTEGRLAPGLINAEAARQTDLPEIDRSIAALIDRWGAFRAVRFEHGLWVVELERAYVTPAIAFDRADRIIEFSAGPLFGSTPPIMAREQGVDAVTRAIAALPGVTSLLVTDNGRTVTSLNPEAYNAVGSSFKMLVLQEAARRVEAGELRWSDIYVLNDRVRVPGGSMASWGNVPVTLATAANEMIAKSDNTATDVVMEVTGRERINNAAPANARPMVSTAELFKLKRADRPDLQAQWRAGNAEQRWQLARSLDAVGLFADDPTLGTVFSPDIEWFFSNRQLCQIAESVAHLPMMQSQPGPAAGLGWPVAAYKGGSEPGVIALTSVLTSAEGRRVCISMTWNKPDSAVDTERVFMLYRSLAFALREAPRS